MTEVAITELIRDSTSTAQRIPASNEALSGGVMLAMIIIALALAKDAAGGDLNIAMLQE